MLQVSEILWPREMELGLGGAARVLGDFTGAFFPLNLQWNSPTVICI